jgi:hypothetical protein
LQLRTTGVIAEILMRTYYDAGKFNSYHTLNDFGANPNEAWHAVK